MLDTTRASLTFAKPLQVEEELVELIDLLTKENVRSYLEVGSRFGGSFERIMTALLHHGMQNLIPSLPFGLSVDFPGSNFGDSSSAPILLAALARLDAIGCKVECVFGPSAASEVVERVRHHAPFDAVMIDADHRYEGVKRDFEIYASMGRIIILHDIAAPPGHTSKTGAKVEVPKLWNEIKHGYRHVEIVAPGSDMGIGVLFR